MNQHAPPPFRLTLTLAALWLSACGGGGGDAALTPAPAPLAAAAATSAATPLMSPMAAAAPASSFAWSVAYPNPLIWHSMSTNATGDVIVAGEAGGQLHVSRDGGASWTSGNSPSGTWISSASTASGDRLFAVQYGGHLYTSRDYGVTWSPITSSPLVYNASSGIAWEAVTVSQDGQRIAAVVQNGAIVLSSDAGATWRAATLPDAPQNRWWRWIDSSSDGRVLVAVSHNGEIYRSSDAGATWRAVTVSVGGTAVVENWYRVKLSADGQTIALAANTFGGAPGSGIFVSRDGGTSWTKGFSLVADYSFIAMSGDGRSIAATVSDTGSTRGRVLLSTDAGASFAALAMPGSDTNWRAIAMSSAADRLAVSAGGFNTQSTGLLYTGRASSAPPPAPAPSPAPTPAPTPAPSPAPSPAPTPAPAPACNPAQWVNTTRYMPGDTVMRNNVMYVATAQSATAWNVGSPPEWTPNYWAVTSCSAPAPAPAPTPAPAPAPTPAPAPPPAPAPSPAPAPACSAAEWTGSIRYMPGDRVMRNGKLYVATQQSATAWNVNSPPEWTPNYWAPGSC